MSTTAVLTREIGSAERTLRALLERQLEGAGISFPEWAVLSFASGPAPLTRDQLVQRQVDGRVASPAGAEASIERLLSAGLLTEVAVGHGRGAARAALALSAAGRTVFEPLRDAVSRITAEVFAGLAPGEVEATRDVLAEVTRRAQERLAAQAG